MHGVAGGDLGGVGVGADEDGDAGLMHGASAGGDGVEGPVGLLCHVWVALDDALLHAEGWDGDGFAFDHWGYVGGRIEGCVHGRVGDDVHSGCDGVLIRFEGAGVRDHLLAVLVCGVNQGAKRLHVKRNHALWKAIIHDDFAIVGPLGNLSLDERSRVRRVLHLCADGPVGGTSGGAKSAESCVGKSIAAGNLA